MLTDQQRCAREQVKMDEVALSLQKAMKGIGTDEDRIIREVAAYSNIQRQLIKTKYLLLTGNELTDDLKSELSGHFLEAILALFTPLGEYEARILHDAMSGVGTEEKKMIEILCSKDADEIRTLKSAYKKVYNRDMERDIKVEESGDLGRIFRSLATGARNENHGYDQEFVQKEAQDLYDAGQGKLGTDEKEFIRILCSRSFAELHAIFAIYKAKFEKDIEQVIKSEFSGNVREALLVIVKCVRNKPAYFAELIYQCVVGKGTNERELIQAIIRRSDIDLKFIKEEYKQNFKKDLEKVIEHEISGDFKKLLLALIGKN